MLALTGVVALTGSGAAQPPRGQVVEGREPDPVVRLFHAVEPATFGYGAGLAAAPAPRAAVELATPWLAVDFLSDLLPNQLTVPLGTAQKAWD